MQTTNQVFSRSRWLLLMRRHWMENGSLYLYGILTILGGIAIAMFFWLLHDHSYQQGALLILYMFGLHIVGAIFASSSFDMLQKKEKGIYYLTLPASHFEKLLTVMVYNALFFTVIFSICFYGMQYLTVWIIKARIAAHPDSFSFTPFLAEKDLWIGGTFKYFAILYFSVQALFILGSVYFRRFSFLLTLIVLFAFLFLLTCYMGSLRKAILPHYYWNGSTLFRDADFHRAYRLPETFKSIVDWICLVGWVPLFYWAAWFRLREKEI